MTDTDKSTFWSTLENILRSQVRPSPAPTTTSTSSTAIPLHPSSTSSSLSHQQNNPSSQNDLLGKQNSQVSFLLSKFLINFSHLCLANASNDTHPLSMSSIEHQFGASTNHSILTDSFSQSYSASHAEHLSSSDEIFKRLCVIISNIFFKSNRII
jgi:hypothetical protein